MGVTSTKNGRSISITWERPPLNVFDLKLLRELDQALTICAQDGEADVIVFQGAGARAFGGRRHSRSQPGKSSRDARRCSWSHSQTAGVAAGHGGRGPRPLFEAAVAKSRARAI